MNKQDKEELILLGLYISEALCCEEKIEKAVAKGNLEAISFHRKQQKAYSDKAKSILDKHSMTESNFYKIIDSLNGSVRDILETFNWS